jgi:hypothetical protein
MRFDLEERPYRQGGNGQDRGVSNARRARKQAHRHHG